MARPRNQTGLPNAYSRQSEDFYWKSVDNEPKGQAELPWITYGETDVLQARGTVVVCCPANLMSHSALTRYVIREYGQEKMFRQRPTMGQAMYLTKSPTAPWTNDIFFYFSRELPTSILYYMTCYSCV